MARLAQQIWTPDSDRRYVDHVIAQTPPRMRAALRAFASWLELDRGLTQGSIVVRLQSVRWFVRAMCKAKQASPSVAFRKVTARDIEDFFVAYGQRSGPVARRSMQAAMRLFIKYSVIRGWCSEGLVGSVPSLRRYRLLHVPRALPPKALDEVLRAVSARGECAKHRAMVFLLATYGVRRGQVARLCLGDIDWKARTILFKAHKRGKAVLHQLVPAIADALAAYLRCERPQTDDEHVFVRDRAPHVRLSPAVIQGVVRRYCQAVQALPATANSLRHAFASRLLCAGHSLKVIADLLGHRSFSAVAVYAKVDRPRLLEVAIEWPGAS
jgi:integrase